MLGAIFVLRTLASEGEVETKTLLRYSSLAGGIISRRALLHFGLNANGTSIEDRVGMAELGDAVNIFMGSIKVLITDMIKALVPEEAFGRDMEFVELKFGRVSGPINVGNEVMKDLIAGSFRGSGIGTWWGRPRQNEGCRIE